MRVAAGSGNKDITMRFPAGSGNMRFPAGSGNKDTPKPVVEGVPSGTGMRAARGTGGPATDDRMPEEPPLVRAPSMPPPPSKSLLMPTWLMPIRFTT
jgi:hypothetical protein